MLYGISLDWGKEREAGGQGCGECIGSTVFDVNTGHLAQDRATVYVFLSLTCRGGISCYSLCGGGGGGGRTGRILCLSNQSPPPCSAHPPPNLPSLVLRPTTARKSEGQVTALKSQSAQARSHPEVLPLSAPTPTPINCASVCVYFSATAHLPSSPGLPAFILSWHWDSRELGGAILPSPYLRTEQGRGPRKGEQRPQS